jgi:hypothetical protein
MPVKQDMLKRIDNHPLWIIIPPVGKPMPPFPPVKQPPYHFPVVPKPIMPKPKKGYNLY